MKRSHLAVLVCPFLLAAAACSDSSGVPPSEPFRQDWTVEVDAVFAYGDPAMPDIGEILIGDTGHDDNFVNRGDVIVNFDGGIDHILVEFRRFSFTHDLELAQADFDKLHLWAYNASTSQPKKPDEMDVEDNCAAAAWMNGCAIKLYYDGQTQPARVGADIRVTLPSNYRYLVDIETTDNDIEDDYQNRGNVCVNNLRGNLNANLQSGLAKVVIADDIRPVPGCSEADTQTCAEGGWDPLCPCATDFGQARVETFDAAASNITFDVPQAVWSKFTLENQQEGQSADAEHCLATVEHPTGVLESDFPWKLTGEANHPELGLNGGGYGLTGISANCAPVRFTEDPADFVGKDKADDQSVEDRGNIHVCVGCMRGQSCDDLI